MTKVGGSPNPHGGGHARIRDIIAQLRSLQMRRVANPFGAMGGETGQPVNDQEHLASLLLSEEAGAVWSSLDRDLKAETCIRLALTDAARGQLDEAARRLEDGLRTPPSDARVRAALHYNLFRAVGPRCREEPVVGEIAAAHYNQAILLDPSLAEFASEYGLVRVVSADAHGALYHVRDDNDADLLVRVLDFTPEDPSVAEMLALEAQTLTEWRHPNLCRVLRYGHGRFRRPFLVLEFVQGVDLERATRTLIAAGRRPTIIGALFEMRPIFDAVSYLHSQTPPWVLRTLLPRDIFLTRSHGLRLTDFGLNDPLSRAGGDDAGYLAPEVRAGRPAGPAADVYSLARLCCFLLSGGPDLIEGLEPPIAEVLYAAVNTNPDQRPAGVAELRAALTQAAGRMTRVTLTAVEGPCTGKKFVFDRWQAFTIGRDPNTDFHLAADGRSSRRHSQIQVRAGEVRIRDLGSSNGTLVNGKKVSEAVLREGDRLLIGDTLLKVEIDFPGSARRPPSSASAAAPGGAPASGSASGSGKEPTRGVAAVGGPPPDSPVRMPAPAHSSAPAPAPAPTSVPAVVIEAFPIEPSRPAEPPSRRGIDDPIPELPPAGAGAAASAANALAALHDNPPATIVDTSLADLLKNVPAAGDTNIEPYAAAPDGADDLADLARPHRPHGSGG